MSCKDCYKCQFKTRSDGSQQLICANDIDGLGVNGFQYCNEWRDVTCTMCRYIHSYSSRCVICQNLDRKPYFESVEVEDDGE